MRSVFQQVTAATSATPNTATRMWPNNTANTTSRWAIIKADDDNTDDIFWGVSEDADFDRLTPGTSYELPMPPDTRFLLSELWVKSATADQNYRILFV